MPRLRCTALFSAIVRAPVRALAGAFVRVFARAFARAHGRCRALGPTLVATTAISLVMATAGCTSRPSASPRASISADVETPAASAANAATPPSASPSASTPERAASLAPSPSTPFGSHTPTPSTAVTPTASANTGRYAHPTSGAAFAATTTTVTAAQLGASWRPGCPVTPAQLRQISLSYWGFDGAAHTGVIVVNATVVPAVIKVFATLYLDRFPVRRMQPVADFGGSDDASMAVDNTSGFNCRNAVTTGPAAWSAHAYGEAIDVNTIENPYIEGGKVLPPAGAAFVKRTPYRPGMAVAGGQLVKAFAAVGWLWGGRWTGSPDYQHFSSTGG